METKNIMTYLDRIGARQYSPYYYEYGVKPYVETLHDRISDEFAIYGRPRNKPYHKRCRELENEEFEISFVWPAQTCKDTRVYYTSYMNKNQDGPVKILDFYCENNNAWFLHFQLIHSPESPIIIIGNRNIAFPVFSCEGEDIECESDGYSSHGFKRYINIGNEKLYFSIKRINRYSLECML